MRFAQEKGIRLFTFACCCIGAAALMLSIGTSNVRAAGSDHVRWDIIHVEFTTPVTIRPGGVAFASADQNNQITFTDSSGTFVAPASGGISGAVTGGGKWETFDGTNTKSGTYTVIGLVSWQLANLAPPGGIDLIDNTHEKANGNAFLRIQYDDGSEGVLGVGCHDGGAPAGIQEGVIATKGYLTYWTGAVHVPGVDANFTAFHILK